jgi:phytoene desaturase
MHQANSSFFKDTKTIQIFDRYATYNGSNPFLAPATLNIIQHVEYNLGGYICEGGMYKIPESLYKAAVNKDVKFHMSTAVNKILHKDNKVTGIETSSGIDYFDIVVSNADVNFTYDKLLNDKSSRQAKRYARMEKSSSAIVFYWGISREFPELEIHNILFSDNYTEEFDDIFTKKTIPADPTVYIYISSKFNKDDAPEGSENWFVMINVPADNNHDWDKLIVSAREKVINKISTVLKVNIDDYITFEEHLTPDAIERTTGSSKGSLYGISSNNKMAAFLRQQNRSRQYRGLYFCGGSAHPGGGIPLVVLSAKITADLINKYEVSHD